MTVTWTRRHGDTGPPLRRVLRTEPTWGQAIGPPADLTGWVVTGIVRRWTDRVIIAATPATQVTPTAGVVDLPLDTMTTTSPGLHSVEWRAQAGPEQRTYPPGPGPDWLLVAADPSGTSGTPEAPTGPLFLADGTTGVVDVDGRVVLAGAGVTLTIDPTVTWFQVAEWSTQTPWGPGTTPVIVQAGATIDPTVPPTLLGAGGDLVAVARHGSTWYAAGSAAPPVGSGVSYTHQQLAAATVWTVTHNLGVLVPDVTLADPGGEEFLADIDFVTPNQLTVTLAVAATGTAYIQA